MSDKTLLQLAQMSKTDIATLQKQLSDAGISPKNENDVVSTQEQEQLAQFLKQSRGVIQKRISIKKTTTSTTKITGTSGKPKAVKVISTKKKTLNALTLPKLPKK